MIQVGLTGGIGSGKSEVARRLAALGAVVIDADVLAREAVAPGSPGLATVVAEFGPQVLADDGSLDRGALGRLVFSDDSGRAALEALIHPHVARRSVELAAAAPDDAVVVHDVPLMVEKGLTAQYDLVVVVDAPDDVRVERLVRFRGIAPDDARARMSAQVRRSDRLAAADVVIENATSLDALDEQVRLLWAGLLRRR